MNLSHRTFAAAVALTLLGAAAGCSHKSEDDAAPAHAEKTAAEPQPGQKGVAALGDHLIVEWKGKTYTATVIQVVSSDRVKIHYDGYANSWDEVVGRDRIRGHAGTAPPAAPKAAAPVAQATHTAGYSLEAIRAVPDNCSTPSVILATAPQSVGASYAWNITRQAFLANQQLRIVSGQPSAPGEVHLAPYEYNGSAYALVATCHDGATCNNVAAMYKAIVRSSNPQVTCGRVNGIGASPVARFEWSGNAMEDLPAAGDTVALCARLDACEIATDRSTPGDPFLECQKAPSRFKTSCATRYPCAEVMACLGK